MLARWARERRREKRVRFRTGAPHQVTLLAAYGLELVDDAAEEVETVDVPPGCAR